MADRDKKIALMRELHENKSLQALRTVVELLNVLIDETRESNDDAHGDQLLRNQGKIEACKTIRDIILKEPPPKDLSKGINLT
jgi:hypothetical protein